MCDWYRMLSIACVITPCEQKGIDMERFLLFNAGCVLCSQLARSIEDESSGWLTVRSLRDTEMQSLLDKANVSRQWKPTLIEVDGENIHVFRGLHLELQLLIGLGPQKAWRIAQMAHDINSSPRSDKTNASRRSFFARSGAAVAGVALGLGLGNSVFDQNAHAEIMSTEQNSRTITRIDLNDAVIKQLRQMDVVQRANIHFGIPSWQEVYKVEDQRTHEAVYMIPYGSQKSSPLVKATFLAIAGSSLQGLEKGVVGQLIHADAQAQVFAWLTPDAHHLVTTKAHKDRQVEVSTQNIYSLGAKGVVPATTDSKISCFNTCLYSYRLNQVCVAICDQCYITGGPPRCTLCYACAGADYSICLLRCVFA